MLGERDGFKRCVWVFRVAQGFALFRVFRFRVVQGASVTDFTRVHLTPLNSVRAEGGRWGGAGPRDVWDSSWCVCVSESLRPNLSRATAEVAFSFHPSGRACQTSATSRQAPGFFEVFQFCSCLHHRVLETIVFFVRRVMFAARLPLLPYPLFRRPPLQLVRRRTDSVCGAAWQVMTSSCTSHDMSFPLESLTPRALGPAALVWRCRPAMIACSSDCAALVGGGRLLSCH